jgi:hypothetical protein
MENDYRTYYCPLYGDAFCHCPEIPPECDGVKMCSDILLAVDETWDLYNENGDA